SRWFDRYPQGRESTYWEGQINVRWKNDTDAPVIVEMWLADSEVHTRLWGSDYYDVSTTTSDPYNLRPRQPSAPMTQNVFRKAAETKASPSTSTAPRPHRTVPLSKNPGAGPTAA